MMSSISWSVAAVWIVAILTFGATLVAVELVSVDCQCVEDLEKSNELP